MNKSPQYNQQSKSDVEEIRIYENMESGRHSIGKLLNSASLPNSPRSAPLYGCRENITS